MKFSTYRFDELTINYDKRRIPLSSMERSKRQGTYRYYGAQGVIDFIDDYIFDGTYMLIAEDGENLKSKKQDIAQIVNGQFWVNNHAHIVQTNEKCNMKYLCYLLNSKDISGFITGSVQPKLSQVNLNAIVFSIPDRATQDIIISILSTIDDKIELNKQLNDNLLQQAQSIFNTKYHAAREQRPFTSLIHVLGGGTPKTENLEFWNGDIPFFTPKDVGIPYTFETEKSITVSGLENCNSRLYPKNTSFVTARGTVGKVALAGRPMAMNQSCYALSSDTVDPILVYFYTLQAVDSLKHKASGAVFDAIVTRDFDTEIISVISEEESIATVSIIKPILDAIHANSEENLWLVALRDALLPRLMSGEIDVSNITL